MAFPYKTIINTKTRQTITFIQTAASTKGALLEMETTYAANSMMPPPHFHPQQSEDFTVLAGSVKVNINNATQILQQGDTLHIPAGTVHAMWNDGPVPAKLNWKIQPALKTEFFFETITGLANDDQTNAHGVPGILQLSLTVPHFKEEIVLTKPAPSLQKFLFIFLRPFATWRKKQAIYPAYIN
ncbi:Cupin domain-containing protein [Chitinophaga skermanii]|uniref:Cupin domain-containing protein n=1 Tax=Chitinophaga skermanii TaxID=331697 RepID=A0A327QB55_9BACT|nr:cupin domain-containing protein [Chitinophaga skermanii]RAJ01660.1 Cupin domain-containing protein [Chitinophaga skermanii]